MTQTDKELYLKVKRKHVKNFVRIVQRVFKDHFKKLENRTQKEQETIGNFLVVLEMEMKKELKSMV